MSILIPTLNSARALEECLASIAAQDYPHDLVEIIVADAGSTDQTLDIARRYTDRIYPNPGKTGEAGKAVALGHATGEIIAFIDSDNILPISAWLRRMVAPFADETIFGSEPLEYTYRATDGLITRYCALMGMNDPLCLFLGNYDRYCTITRKWTEMPVDVEDRGDYLKVVLHEQGVPTIGANGFLIRREALLQVAVSEYLVDIDMVCDLVSRGRNTIAKVKVGIIHLFSGNISTFVRKQRRRIHDYVYFRDRQVRTYPWGRLQKWRFAKFILYCVAIVPVVMQGVIGFSRKPDRAWLFHPLACWLTLWVYGLGTVKSWISHTRPLERTSWSQ